MRVLDIIKWIEGYVKVEAEANNASAFLSFLASRGITVNKVTRNTDRIYFEVSLKNYKNIRKLKKEFGRKVKLRHINLCGLPRKMQVLIKRKSLGIGLALFFAVLILFSRFIWKIEIVGNYTIKEAEIIAAYTELGVWEGMAKACLDSYKIRDRFTLKIDKVSWCSFNVEGSVLTINISEVRESDKAGKLSHSNLVAECDGIIKKLDVVSGYSKVKVGDVISRGELLVSGVPENSGVFTWSKGKVFAETEHTFKIRVPKKCEEITILERAQERIAIDVFGLKIPLYLDNIHFQNVSEIDRKELEVLGEKLPIALITRRFYEAEKKVQNKTYEECENDSVALLLEICKERKAENLEILEKEFLEDTESYTFIYKCRLIEDIAEVRKINVTS